MKIKNERPDVNDEYFIYQSIIGGFPSDRQISDNWIRRVKDYLIKVVREAKVKSNWESPNEQYENACTDFVERLLRDSNSFLPLILPFVQDVIDNASINALGQLLIKLTSPGIPDVYQGCELWDLSFVDPDNRRPVDFQIRKTHLLEIIEKEKEGNEQLFSFLSSNREQGLEKLFVSWKVLNFRRNNEHIFKVGAYLPLQVLRGDLAICAFARRLQENWIVVIVPLARARRVRPTWTDESIALSQDLPSNWTNVFTNQNLESKEELPLQQLLAEFPIALLTNKKGAV